MSLEFRIEHGSGTTHVIEGTRSEELHEFGTQSIASLYTTRPELNRVRLNEGTDHIYAEENGERLFGGVLRDVIRSGTEPELVVESFERLAREAEPSDGDLIYNNARDSRIYTEAAEDIPDLALRFHGVTDFTTMVFNYASPAKRIRKTADALGKEVAYTAEKTVEVHGEMGEDRSDVTLSPSAENISGDFRPERHSGGDEITHLKLLGTGEGAAQVEANLVPEADSKSYTNKYTYKNYDWDAGDHKKWDTRINKGISDPETLGEHGIELINELKQQFVEVDITVEDHDVGLGDLFHLRNDTERFDEQLRAVEVERIVDQAGRRYNVLFSNRRLSRQRADDEEKKDLDRYKMAFEGSPITLSHGGGRQPVNGRLNYEFSFYYPAEVTYEHRVKLQIFGKAYRAYSSGAAASGGQHSHDVSISDHEHSVDIPSHSHSVSVSDHSHDMPSLTHDHPISGSDTTDGADGSGIHTHDFDFFEYTNLESPGDGTTSDAGGGFNTTSSSGGGSTETTSSGGDDFTTTSEDGGEHTHDPNPGITEFTEFPQNCNVLVNGQSVGVSVGDGDGEFEASVDLAGYLNPGTVNTIEVTSSTLGHLQAHIDVDCFRQVLGRG